MWLLAIPHFQNTIYKLYSKCSSSTYNYPIALVTMAEHIGDYTVLNKIIGKDLLKEPGLDWRLLGDGVVHFLKD